MDSLDDPAVLFLHSIWSASDAALRDPVPPAEALRIPVMEDISGCHRMTDTLSYPAPTFNGFREA